MSRDEAEIVTEWEESVLNRVDELLVIAAREIGPPDGATKEHIADLG